MFVYRHLQANDLLTFPDMGDGDMSAEQRREALDRIVNAQRPLTAVVLFLHVVALEDFIRDLGARLAAVGGLDAYFPNVAELGLELKKNPAPFARLDKDPARLHDPAAVNALYQRVFGIEPLDQALLPVLHDLFLIRHTVAHHAALVRPLDVPRFQHWDVQPNVTINPPLEFVKSLGMTIYRTGAAFDVAVRNRIFAVLVPTLAPDWPQNPPQLLVTLIETFNWFGKLLERNEPPLDHTAPNYEQLREAEIGRAKEALLALCLHDLRTMHPA